MAWKIHVRGIVQGVGFRPFVYRLAVAYGLSGWVFNAVDGVHILIEGSPGTIDAFCRDLETEPPGAAFITGITREQTTERVEPGFVIRTSRIASGERTLVSPDLATCPDCLTQLFDPLDRRYHYPFINCTNCGPRFTIINQLPYDRAQTSMSRFTLCALCTYEYHDPVDRRFHAQPNACFDCGPRLELMIARQGEARQGASQGDGSPDLQGQGDGFPSQGDGSPDLQGQGDASQGDASQGDASQGDGSPDSYPVTVDAIIARSAELFLEGATVAVKGLGGYHLACDATNEQAVLRLRERKQRPRKPLAVMYPSLEQVRQDYEVTDAEAALLSSSATPIVLLRNKDGRIASSVTCGLTEIGVMLPATPVQHLLLKAVDKPLVMTSGNLSEEPIIGDDLLAQTQLHEVADAFLMNDRPIVSRYDDSVVRVLAGTQGTSPSVSSPPDTLQFIRRARGYAPTPFKLQSGLQKGQTILAVGPEQKNTFCLASGTDAFISQHLGDLNTASTFDNYLKTLQLYEKLFDLKPSVLVSDMHPDYLSTKWARKQAQSLNLPLIQVQHHHAHIAAVLSEELVESSWHRMTRPPDTDRHPSTHLLDTRQEVIGIALDGTGYGTDGTIWGGEVLVASLASCRRFAHLEPFRLPGGAQAIRHPLRAAYSLLLHHDLQDHPAALGVAERLGKEGALLIERMVEKEINAPLTSSAGRLFDAVSALLEVCDAASYEGEPAILLEAALQQGALQQGALQQGALQHSVALRSEATTGISESAALPILTREIILTILDGREAGEPVAGLSRYFHEALMHAFVSSALSAREHTSINTVALSGGVFNNRFIATYLPCLLEHEGFQVLTHKKLPPNDGCISYGQAAVVCARLNTTQEAGTLPPCV